MATCTGILAAVGVVLATSGVFASELADRVQMRVRLVDYSALLPWKLEAAEQQVAMIYAAAGVDIIWIQPALPRRGDGQTFDVLLLSPRMTDRLVQAEGVPPHVLGQASRNAMRAYILTERATLLASRLGADIGDALGVLIAHELGHMFLPGHYPVGIMQESYEFRSRAARRFTPEQADVIRHALTGIGRP